MCSPIVFLLFINHHSFFIFIYWLSSVPYCLFSPMKLYIALIIGIALAALILASYLFIWGFDEARHKISLTGIFLIIFALLILVSYKRLFRRRLSRLGSFRSWLRVHQILAVCGITLIAAHSTLQPRSWHSLVAISLASFVLLSGLATSLIKGQVWKKVYTLHWILAPILLISVTLHGTLRTRHDQFLALDKNHEVFCAKCHIKDPTYKSYSCLGCHVHNTPEIQEQHVMHGIADFPRCLDCHSAKLKGKDYGSLRAYPGSMVR